MASKSAEFIMDEPVMNLVAALAQGFQVFSGRVVSVFIAMVHKKMFGATAPLTSLFEVSSVLVDAACPARMLGTLANEAARKQGQLRLFGFLSGNASTLDRTKLSVTSADKRRTAESAVAEHIWAMLTSSLQVEASDRTVGRLWPFGLNKRLLATLADFLFTHVRLGSVVY